LLTKGLIEDVDSVVAQIEAITADDVQAVARRVVGRERVHCAVVGPDIDDAEIEAAMA